MGTFVTSSLPCEVRVNGKVLFKGMVDRVVVEPHLQEVHDRFGSAGHLYYGTGDIALRWTGAQVLDGSVLVADGPEAALPMLTDSAAQELAKKYGYHGLFSMLREAYEMGQKSLA